MLTRRLLGAAAAGLVASGSARAQGGFPDRALRILVGYPPGGGVDIFARLIGEQMRLALGQPVLVENRPGASAMIAANAVARAAPDGYTLLMAAAGEVAVNPALYKDRMSYDPARELAPIALAGTIPCLVVVPTSLPVRTPAELIAYCKANRGQLSFSSSGIGNPQQLAGELMNFMAGTDVLHVPYRGSAPAVTDVAAGRVTMSFSSLGAALPLIQAGQLRPVAVTSKERMPQLPDVAALAEAPGMAGYELINWFGMFCSADVPAPIQARLAGAASAAIADPAMAAKLFEQGAIPRQLTQDAMRSFVAEETRKFAEIITRANISVEG
ncbi:MULTISPECIES: tripartite tricarboxylate transporter substrate-binding protein [Roseomonadaceae]|uniref:Tripartite tricarboxylate transporter substrate binding protein n=1 Tax=Falsiroseomonas oleicola TaxID=2801474 RepID=A0ABS6H810_9PROT|nr:tripartite tricarboxylate transporter substrate-binding protein [Roseomonas oleicola]MBU8544834.1 tripartite tricarboxylate transporter substrate binding protein [Roseomonas oleicola]